jgi:quercetin dioxygenase-like cupin family protein
VRKLGLLVVLLTGALATSSAAPSDPPVLSSTAVTWEEIQARGPAESRARQVFRNPTATLDELELHVTTLPPGQDSHPPHKHPDEEVIIIKQGTLEAMVNGVTRRVGPGSVIFQAADQLHGIRNVGDTPAVYHVIRWNSPGMLAARKKD